MSLVALIVVHVERAGSALTDPKLQLAFLCSWPPPFPFRLLPCGRRNLTVPTWENRAVIRCVALVSLVGLLVLTVPVARNLSAAGGIIPLPLVSRGVPAYTNDDCGGTYPATNADNGNYADYWRTCGTPSDTSPLWLAYDLSGQALGRVVVAWYNDPVSGDYDTSVNSDDYNVPASYTIDANSAPGGSVPTAGWVTLVSVSANVYHSRQHVIDLTGYNWLRFQATASYGRQGDTGVAINLDVQDARQGLQDDWIMYGDSITAAGMTHGDDTGAVGTFAQLVNAEDPAYYPVQEDGGTGYLKSAEGAADVPQWLNLFPGHYVGLSYGTNDALGGCDSSALSAFYANYVTMVNAVLAAGKVPIVPTIPWGTASNLPTCVPEYNAEIALLYAAYPQILPGPDLYSYFEANPSLISSDGIHPSIPAGADAYRQQWANMAVAEVYDAATTATPTPPAVTDTPPTDTPTATSASTAMPTTTSTSTATGTPTNTPQPPSSTPTASDTATSTPVPQTSAPTGGSSPPGGGQAPIRAVPIAAATPSASPTATPPWATATSSATATPAAAPATSPSSTPDVFGAVPRVVSTLAAVGAATPVPLPRVLVSNSPRTVIGGRHQACSQVQSGRNSPEPGCEAVSVVLVPHARIAIILSFQDKSAQHYAGNTDSTGRLHHLFAVSYMPRTTSPGHPVAPLSIRSTAHITVQATLPNGMRLAPVTLRFTVARP